MTDQSQASAPVAAPAPRRSPLPYVALLLSLAAAAAAGWLWFDAHREFSALERDVAKRLAELDTLNREARMLAGQSRDTMSDVSARLGQLEARVYETQNQRIALESLYQDLSRGRDEWALAEVEQTLLIAGQQLQLAGNLKAALIALEAADARLARMDRPQLTSLRRIISRDIERLRAAPQVDIAGMAVRLDNIMNQIDALPLAMEQRPARAGPPSEPAAGNFWQRLWREAKLDLRNLIRIQNVDKPEVPLIAPDQAFFLRENLRIRLLGARLALLARDQKSLETDLKAASEWLSRYYDETNKSVTMVQSALKQLLQSNIDNPLPDISESLDAVRNVKLVRERALR